MFVLTRSPRSVLLSSLLTSLALLVLLSAFSISASATTIVVPVGGDLQAAVNSAQRGDTIVLQVATFNIATPDTGLVLPVKSGTFNGSNYITIQTANLSSLPSARVSPSDGVNMPKLVATLKGAPVMTIRGTGYQFIGLEITNNLTGNTSGDVTVSMVAQNGSNVVFDRCLVHPREHPTSANNWLTRGKFAFTVNGSYTTIQRSYVYDFYGRDPYSSQFTNGSGQQTEAVYVSPTADHVTVDNNYLQAWYATMQTAGSDGTPINPVQVLANPAPTWTSARLSSTAGLGPNMIIALDIPHIDDPSKCPNGGQGFDTPCYAVARVATVDSTTGDVTFATPLVIKNAYGYRMLPYALPMTGSGSSAIWQGTQPSNIVMTHNTLEVPVDFSTYHMSTNGNTGKGVIETKASLNFLFEGNVITGFPSTLAFTTANQNCGAPWQTTAYTTVRNNWFQTYRTGILASFTDYGCVCTQGHDLIVDNNLFTGGITTSDFLRLSGPAANITVTHNTVTGGFMTSDGSTYTGSAWSASSVSNGGCTNSATGGGTPCTGSQQYYPVDKATGVVIRDNLTDAGNYTAICYDPSGNGSPYFNCFANPVQDHNMFVFNVPGSGNPFPGAFTASSWSNIFVNPSGSDWRCSSSAGCYRAASDGKDIGVDYNQLVAAIGGAAPAPTPTPTGTPTPTATPTPTPTATPTPNPSPTPTPTPTPVTVSITSPTTNSTYAAGDSVTFKASASSLNGTITSVSYKTSTQIIGTATIAPYNLIWSGMSSGNYTVTATAQDNQGRSNTSSGIMVKISKALRGVRGNKNTTTTINSTISQTQVGLVSISSAQSNALQSLVTGLDQTYSDFLDEKSMFASATVIDKYLLATSFLARSALGLSSAQTPSSAVSDRLKKINGYLSFCEDLMVNGVISSSTITEANRVNALRNLSIGLPDAVPVGFSGVNLLTSQVARISAPASNPFSTQTASSSGGGSVELGSVSVTVDGLAANILSVSPTELMIVVPATLPSGLAELIVSSREGFLHYGTANVNGLNPVILGVTGDTNGRGAIVDSLGSVYGSFQTTTSSLLIGMDGRTRLSILATGLSSGLINSDRSNDIWLSNGQMMDNLAELVSVQARTSDGRVFNLPVEYAGAQGTLRGIDQVNVVLVPELAHAANVQLTIIAKGISSNSKTISLN